MAWPKIIEVAGVKVPVDSWEELREAILELGQGLAVPESGSAPRREDTNNGAAPGGLNHADRTLLSQFLDAGERGLLTQQLGQALGKQGKGVRPALERWSRKIGLVTEENATAFEPIKRYDGRGFKMVQHYRLIGGAMLGRPVP